MTRRLFGLIIVACLLLMAGCDEPQKPPYVAVGTVRNVWERVGYTIVTFEHDNKQLSNITVCLWVSSPPPVWAGMRIRITYTVFSSGNCTNILGIERLE